MKIIEWNKLMQDKTNAELVNFDQAVKNLLWSVPEVKKEFSSLIFLQGLAVNIVKDRAEKEREFLKKEAKQ
jgi:hypothetical protein